MPARRFPPPWTIEDNGVCFILRDNNGQALAYVYFENEPGQADSCKLAHASGGRLAARVVTQSRHSIEQLQPMPDCCPQLVRSLGATD